GPLIARDLRARLPPRAAHVRAGRPLPARGGRPWDGPLVVPASLAHAGFLGVPDGLHGARPDRRDLPGALQPLPAQPRAARRVEHLSDDDIRHLRRGGHDMRKLYAAFQAASQPNGKPAVVLAKTIKGYALGEGAEARNVAHQQKKMSLQELKAFRDRLELKVP